MPGGGGAPTRICPICAVGGAMPPEEIGGAPIGGPLCAGGITPPGGPPIIGGGAPIIAGGAPGGREPGGPPIGGAPIGGGPPIGGPLGGPPICAGGPGRIIAGGPVWPGGIAPGGPGRITPGGAPEHDERMDRTRKERACRVRDVAARERGSNALERETFRARLLLVQRRDSRARSDTRSRASRVPGAIPGGPGGPVDPGGPRGGPGGGCIARESLPAPRQLLCRAMTTTRGV